jgi:hypothetical protein
MHVCVYTMANICIYLCVVRMWLYGADACTHMFMHMYVRMSMVKYKYIYMHYIFL